MSQKLLRTAWRESNGEWNRFKKGEADIDLRVLLTVMAARYYENKFDENGQRTHYPSDEQIARKVDFLHRLLTDSGRNLNIQIRNVGKTQKQNLFTLLPFLRKIFCGENQSKQ